MTPFDVVIVICSMVTGQCHEEMVGKWAERFPTPWECAKYGQQEAVKLIEKYPDYKVAKFGCARRREAA